MQFRLHVLTIFTVALLLCSFTLAQTPATGTVTIQGWDLGPVYPCGNSSCPTYDSGMVQLTVGGFTAISGFSHTIGQSTAEALAIKLASQLNGVNSPVVATRSNTRLVLTSKVSGIAANYALSAAVTHTTLFPVASFSVITSGSSLTGGTAGSSGSGSGGSAP